MYLPIKELEKEFSISRSTVKRVIDFMHEHGERYDEDCFYDIGGRVRVSLDAFKDALHYRENRRKEYELGELAHDGYFM